MPRPPWTLPWRPKDDPVGRHRPEAGSRRARRPSRRRAVRCVVRGPCRGWHSLAPGSDGQPVPAPHHGRSPLRWIRDRARGAHFRARARRCAGRQGMARPARSTISKPAGAPAALPDRCREHRAVSAARGVRRHGRDRLRGAAPADRPRRMYRRGERDLHVLDHRPSTGFHRRRGSPVRGLHRSWCWP